MFLYIELCETLQMNIFITRLLVAPPRPAPHPPPFLYICLAPYRGFIQMIWILIQLVKLPALLVLKVHFPCLSRHTHTHTHTSCLIHLFSVFWNICTVFWCLLHCTFLFVVYKTCLLFNKLKELFVYTHTCDSSPTGWCSWLWGVFCIPRGLRRSVLQNSVRVCSPR